MIRQNASAFVPWPPASIWFRPEEVTTTAALPGTGSAVRPRLPRRTSGSCPGFPVVPDELGLRRDLLLAGLRHASVDHGSTRAGAALPRRDPGAPPAGAEPAPPPRPARPARLHPPFSPVPPTA